MGIYITRTSKQNCIIEEIKNIFQKTVGLKIFKIKDIQKYGETKNMF